MPLTIGDIKAQMAQIKADYEKARRAYRQLLADEDRHNPAAWVGSVAFRPRPESPELKAARAVLNGYADAYNKRLAVIKRHHDRNVAAADAAAQVADIRAKRCDTCFEVRAANGNCGCL
jgi:hypothetical protein